MIFEDKTTACINTKYMSPSLKKSLDGSAQEKVQQTRRVRENGCEDVHFDFAGLLFMVSQPTPPTCPPRNKALLAIGFP